MSGPAAVGSDDRREMVELRETVSRRAVVRLAGTSANGKRMMTTAVAYDATPATYDDSFYARRFQGGDTVRCSDNPDDCRVLWTWSDWLWLCSLDARSAPFTARARDCDLVKQAEEPLWPYR